MTKCAIRGCENELLPHDPESFIIRADGICEECEYVLDLGDDVAIPTEDTFKLIVEEVVDNYRFQFHGAHYQIASEGKYHLLFAGSAEFNDYMVVGLFYNKRDAIEIALSMQEEYNAEGA